MYAQKVISLERVNITQDKRSILQNVNLQVTEGDFLYIIGDVGSGKTSLLKLLYAEYKLKEGIGHVLDYNLRKLKMSRRPFLRRNLGFVFQDFRLLNDRNVYENYKFVLKATGWKNRKHIDGRIKEVLEMVGMSDKIKSMPQILSGGEQQQISLGRALLNDPPIILADEPTGHLDPRSMRRLMETLANVHKQHKTIIMATHDYEAIEQYPQKIVRCKEKKLLETVTP